jgi:hypothetical protein
LQHKSKIVREQLGVHLDQLVQTGVLSSYSLDKAKTRDGFVFMFRPGSAFFNDYERFYGTAIKASCNGIFMPIGAR